jgi:hypothetical protein
MKRIIELVHGAARKRAGLALVAASFSLVLSTPCWAVDWAMTYGGSGADQANSIAQTTDGAGNPDGYVVAGSSASFGGVWVLKLGLDGTVAWEKAYGSSGDSAQAIQQTAEGGYVVAAAMNSEAAVLKLNADGTVAWSKGYGGNSLNAVRQTVDGLGDPDGYIVAGQTDASGAGGRDLWVLRLNLDGTIAWQNTYGGPNGDNARSIQQTADGGYIVAGLTASFGSGLCDAWILRLSADGSVVWQKTYGTLDSGSSPVDDEAYSIQQTADGGYIAAGRSYSSASLLKLDADGTVVWQKTYRGNVAYCVQQTADGGYLVAGYIHVGSNWEYRQIWLLRVDGAGATVFEKKYGTPADEYAQSVVETPDGCVVAGYSRPTFELSSNEICVVKLDANGDLPSCPRLAIGVTPVAHEAAPVVQDTTVAPQVSSAVAADLGAAARDTASTAAEMCSLLPNAPPNTPANPSPASMATGVAQPTVLSWTGGDPDPDDTVTYKVWLGTDNLYGMKVVASGLTEPTCTLGELRCYQKYYWKVMAKDSHGAKTKGPVLLGAWSSWSFTTTDEGCPAIDSLSPTSCYTRDVVSILGRNFGATKGVVRVGTDAYQPDDPDILSWTDTQIDFRVKPHYDWLCYSYHFPFVWVKAGPPDSQIKSNRLKLQITQDDKTSPVACPRIDVIYPSPAYPQDEIILLGLNFGNERGVIVLQKIIGHTFPSDYPDEAAIPIWGFLTKYEPSSSKILKWTDTEIRFRLMAFSDWPPPGTTKKLRIKLKVGPAGARLKYCREGLRVTVP